MTRVQKLAISLIAMVVLELGLAYLADAFSPMLLLAVIQVCAVILANVGAYDD